MFLTVTAKQTSGVTAELTELKLKQQQEKLNLERINFSFHSTLVLHVLL